jgi:hypothetical protein
MGGRNEISDKRPANLSINARVERDGIWSDKVRTF